MTSVPARSEKVRCTGVALCCALVLACTSEAPTRAVPHKAQLVERVRADLSRSARGLSKQVRPDGMTEQRVQSGFRHATIVMRGPDGERRVRCVDQPEQASRMLLEGRE